MIRPRRQVCFELFAHRGARAAAAIGAALILAVAAAAVAQPAANGVYAPGEAAVTGFSGVVRPIEIAPGLDPDAATFIDPDGPSLRVVDLSRMGGLPQAQLVAAPKPFTVHAASIGQVFGVAIDDSAPPNLYVAATSAYGLPIAARGPDGRLRHVRIGEPGTTFMPGLWGPGGGPGSIWKINGADGAVSRFTDVAANGRTNSGPALGGLAYDPETKSLFVADRESGLVHRFGLDGVERGAYDHGLAGTAAVGLPPAPASDRPGLDVETPAFDSARPETWGLAPAERRVFGLAVHGRRLFYAVAKGLEVWSVGLNPDGSFAADATIEVAAPPAAGPTEISQIAFDDQGRMYLAERPAPTGAFDFEALSAPAIGRLLRYAVIGATTTGRRIWQPSPDEYSVGFPPNFRNDNGGVAIGESYAADGEIDVRSCGGFVWTTGERLRDAADWRIAVQLGDKDERAIDGLQGDPAWRIRRDDEPPYVSYFVDYADAPPDFSARGHMGAAAIAPSCVGAAGLAPAEPGAEFAPGFAASAPPAAAVSPPPPPPVASPAPTPVASPVPTPQPPPGGPSAPPPSRVCQTRVCGPTGEPVCQRNQVWRETTNECAPNCERDEVLVSGRCCGVNALSGGGCANGGGPQCGANQTSVGPGRQCCDNDRVYADGAGGAACCAAAVVGGKCASTPPPPTSTCASGYVPIGGDCCLAGQATAAGLCCPSGQTPSPDNATCQTSTRVPKGGQCCAPGSVPSGTGQCCASANLTSTGQCCSTPVDPNNRRACPAKNEEQRKVRCKPGEVEAPGGGCTPSSPQACPPGEARDADGRCVSAAPQPCPVGEARNADGRCVPAAPQPCPVGEARNADGRCVPAAPQACPPGETRDVDGRCVPAAPQPCPVGETRNFDGRCVSAAPQACPPGETRDADGRCVAAAPQPCPPGEARNVDGRCVSAAPPVPAPPVPAQPAAPIAPPPAPTTAPALHCPSGMEPGPLGQHCWPVKATPGAPAGPGLHCPPGTEPGPLGRRCWPVKARPAAPPLTFAPARRPGCPPVKGCARRRP